ncbi:MAG: M23 family metallopeptidase [Cyclobacteriaceae bacterium]|nr:M23 family metallopeptidase [Cyclobacteriaceae bacterium]
MKAKKTLTERLTTRYQLVIRNEENLAERTTFAFTYAKVLTLSVILFVILFGSSLFLSKTLLAKWFDPRHAQMEANKKLYQLALKADSLAIEVDRKDKFIQNFQRILRGDTTNGFEDPAEALRGQERPVRTSSLRLQPSDSAFRREYEQSDGAVVALASNKYRELQETFFFSPLTGFVSDKYDVKKAHFGIDIVTKSNEPVKCIADGTVVMASWTQDSGYVIAVQHRGNLISVYKHNADLLRKVGNFVNAGDIISIVGNSGEMTNGPHLHFELWYNGNALNPEEFVTF